ncbi:MAG: DUF3313 family protein [Xanthomonadales bacterium]|jgi:hypothetical protein|nr:DUF3313 family protein [Xanthomonadales bacterium]
MIKQGIFALLLALLPLPAAVHADIDPALVEGMSPAEWDDVDTLYTRGEVDLTRFRSVLIEAPSVEMRNGWLRQQNRVRVSPQDRIRPEDEEKIQEELSADLVDRFTATLDRAGFRVVAEAGPDTLVVRPSLVRVDVFDPNLAYRQSARRVTVPSAQAGSNLIATDMTLQLQFFEGASDAALIVAEDRLQARKVTSNIGLDVTDRQANAVIFDRWASKLVKALNGA